ncbi:hypothetical protein GCM10023149_32760 [Mucilaginibacter gynuensis]|uniref:Membrane protein (TIGR02226 family) n=1 Tax=Mucilaginibacter gynuensis TaxID=1302236 RepID=A0ABP8GRA2_9SPHI
MDSKYIIIIICILLAAFSVWWELARANRSRLLLRGISVLLAIAALACIALPISYNGDKTISGNDAVLLTDGFDADSLSRFNGLKIYTADSSLHKKYPQAKLISTPADLAGTGISQLHITGFGLEEDELKQLNGVPLKFHPQSAPQGITTISWNAQLHEGGELRVQGSYKNTSAQKIKLVLKGLSTGLDSGIVQPNTIATFDLKTRPKHIGRSAYTLLAIGKDTLEQEAIPVEIKPVKPLKILMLASAPDFETRFLKNWLTQNGYAVACRSAISKDKFNSEYINIDQLPLGSISATLLQKFDAVIGDQATLKTLKPVESAVLKQEVTQHGLGIIIRADSAGRSSSWLQQNFVVEILPGKEIATAFNLQGSTAKTAKLNFDRTVLRTQTSTQILVDDGQAHPVAATAIAGTGRLVYTTLNNTFNWMLAGNTADYTAYWSLLISNAARKAPVAQHWEVVSPLAVLNKPALLRLNGTFNAENSISINGIKSPPRQDELLPFEQVFAYYPESEGWQPATQQNGVTQWWYAYKKDSWPALHAAEKIALTNSYIATHNNLVTVTKQIHSLQQIEVPKLYFYMLLFAACTFLWIEQKISFR